MEFVYKGNETAITYGSVELATSTKSMTEPNVTENTVQFNQRYSDALLPLSVIFGLTAFLGVIGNSLVLASYIKRRDLKDKNFRWYVFCIGSLDIATCLISIPAEIVKHRFFFIFCSNELCKTKCFVNIFTAASLPCCFLVLAVDRYIWVSRSLKENFSKKITPQLAWKLCIIALVVSLMIAVPGGIMCGAMTITVLNKAKEEIIVYVCQTDEVYQGNVFTLIYRLALLIFLVVIGISLIAICIAIYSMLHRSKIAHQTTSQTEMEGNNESVLNSDSSLTSNIKLVSAMTVTIIVTYLLYIGLSFMDISNMSEAKFVLFNLAYRIYFLRCAMNPLFFGIFDDIFRQFWKTLIC
ncbi:hypothetical protein CHS0354_036445 [Potamilus streckersoni]|uniref:G-protein coupled receptors family 1 profile domain-containing protein n=1 Tax=Potamilus streckersoni TaxID=2493646 RepID=A0AAE0SWV1_9BIVA|nr:hypothetical protein CHS0354_036445 [Potamilus streckersoni]